MDISKVRDTKKDGVIAYRFSYPVVPSRTLYLNIIADYSCTNECLFCGRPRDKEEYGKANVYEHGANASLYLSESPSIDEAMEAIASNIKSEDKEIAFVGLGEPLLYFDKVIGVLDRIRAKYDIRTRIDTNGAVRFTRPDAAHELAKAGLDEIRISVNAVNEEEYNALCRPKLKGTYQAMLTFLKECKTVGIDTKASFVMGFHIEGLERRTDEDYITFAESIGLPRDDVVLRRYLS